MPHEVAKLVAQGKIVARFHGRMEWGARSLGNRSILTNASDLGVIETINRMIKNRDFWMPFAPVIMAEEATRYLQGYGKVRAPFMVLSFDSTKEAQIHLRAAMHAYDKTVRPQVVEKIHNPEYWQILKEYKAITGMGGMLNTSFNIHGEPIVCSPYDALDVFMRSGLEYLAIGNYLVTKRTGKSNAR